MTTRLLNSRRPTTAPTPTKPSFTKIHGDNWKELKKISHCETSIAGQEHCKATSSTGSTSVHIAEVTGIVSVGAWQLSRHLFVPSSVSVIKLCDYLAGLDDDDPMVECRLPGFHGDESKILIHRSRLEFVGGALAALVPSEFSCNDRVFINLTDRDTPTIFKFIRKFLYCQVLDLSELDIESLLGLAFSCHRWGLRDLFQAVLLYLENCNLLVSGQVVLYAAYLLKLEWVGQRFKRFFCAQLCAEIDSIIAILVKGEDTRISGSCLLSLAGEDWLWQTTYAENIFSYIIKQLSYEMRIKHQGYLVYIVMRYLEPMIEEDDIIINLLLQLGWNDSDAGAKVFSHVTWIRTWSSRALRLCAIAMRSPVARGISVTIPIRLQVGDLKGGGRVVVRSSRYSVGSTVFYLSCGREMGETDVDWDGYGKRRYQGLSLYVHLDNESSEILESDMLSGFSKFKVWARVTNDGCRCGLNICGGKSWHGLLKEMRDEFNLERAVVGGVHHGWNSFLGESDIESWTRLHDDCCSLTITVAIELVRAYPKGNARKQDHATG